MEMNLDLIRLIFLKNFYLNQTNNDIYMHLNILHVVRYIIEVLVEFVRYLYQLYKENKDILINKYHNYQNIFLINIEFH